MRRKVKITKLPTAAKGHAGNGYVNTIPEQTSNWGGVDTNSWRMGGDISTNRTLSPVPRDEANIEAEKGEVAYGDINGDMFAETYLIGGQRHSNGGTPLNVPEGTFIYSDFRDMKIKDPALLAFFGKTTAKGKSMKKGGYTPADLAKPYDINKYREILEDPNSDKHDRKTAELMIKEYQMKLGALALAQESKKNYEQGIPQVAWPFMQKMGLSEKDIIKNPQPQQEPQQEPMMMARHGGYNLATGLQLPDVYRQGGDFKPHVMYNPETGEEFPANTYDQHIEMSDQGYVHELPKAQNGLNLPEYEGTDIDTRWSGSADHARIYQAINEELINQDPNIEGNELSEFAKKLIEQTREALKEKERYKGKSGGYSKMWEKLYGSVDNLTEEQILNAWLNHQQRNLMLNASGIEANLYKDSNGQLKSSAQIQQLVNPATKEKYTKAEADAVRKNATDKGYTSLDKAFKTMGMPLGDNQSKRLEQATFHGFNRMLDHSDEFTPELQERLKRWTPDQQRGMADETGQGTGVSSQISPIDAYYTNTTAGHLVGLGLPGEKEEEKTIETDEEDTDTDVDNQELLDAYQAAPTGPWAQDVLNLAASFGPRKDYYPWAPDMARTQVELPRVDPTREIAALSEQTGMANRALSSMAGSGAGSRAARLAGVAGAQAANIANTMSRYDDKNVGLEAQETMTNAQLDQAFNQAKYNRDKTLYDDTIRTMANADYQREVDKYNRVGLLNALKTNQMKTDALNQMYPQYAVDPTNWGEMAFTQGKPQQPNLAQDFDKSLAHYKGLGMSDKDAINAAKYRMAQKTGSGYTGPNIDQSMQMYTQRGGFINGSDVFPFMFY